jgi:ergothioneine biosynthesis protein EgtB
MHAGSLTAVLPPSDPVGRTGDAAALAAALQASRADTLAMFARWRRALPDLQVPCRPDLNPPLWELGHIGWFQTWWLGRNPACAQGWEAVPDTPRNAPAQAGADALYDSSRVPHATRWDLPLPSIDETLSELARGLAETLNMLAGIGDGDRDGRSLYFHRLALLHEDMHHEAGLYMAQALGVATDDDPRWQPRALPDPGPPLRLADAVWHLGSEPLGNGAFAFDNELGAHAVPVDAFEIDTQGVRWAEFLPFVESGGYTQPRWWTPQGWAWLHGGAVPVDAPRYLRRLGSHWQRWRHGHWAELDRREPACHLTQHEAQAWCAWAGRRLPTEAEWESAACSHPEAFHWGDVWEWTASAFAPYPGFQPHPYRDYSAPWFDGRPVLRGASFMTQPRMRHPRYRNYFTPERNDLAAGFRSCAR